MQTQQRTGAQPTLGISKGFAPRTLRGPGGSPRRQSAGLRRSWFAATPARQAACFLLLSVLLYAGLYAVSDNLVYATGFRNRFFVIKTSQRPDFDYVIVGASHAVPLDFADMTPRLEDMTGSRIVNLSTVSSGILVNRLMLDYFWVEHRSQTVLYIFDAGVFYSSRWNEGRLNDVRLYSRAPFDPDLARMLVLNPLTAWQGLNYASGFSKINNADRFRSDVSDDERLKFDKTYAPEQQIDALRFQNFYPDGADHDVFVRYLHAFEETLKSLQQRGIRVLVVKPPVSGGWYSMLPDEGWSDGMLTDFLARDQIPYHDFSQVMLDDRWYYDADHLNRSGVMHFFEYYLVPAMEGFTAGG